MNTIERRSFLKLLTAAGITSGLDPTFLHAERKYLPRQKGSYSPAKIVNEYYEFLPGERSALATPPVIIQADAMGVHLQTGSNSRALSIGETVDGWHLVTVVEMNGAPTAVFEKHVTHRGAIAFVTAEGGTIALIPKGIGDLAKIRPRQITAPADVQLRRPARYIPGPD